MDWLNFGEVDFISSPQSPPPSAPEDDNLDMFTFLNHDFSPSESESISCRLKSKIIEGDEDLQEISREGLSHPRDSFGDSEFQEHDVAEMYESLLSNECPANPSDSPFFELEKVTEVANSVKSSTPFVDESTRNFLQAIDNFLGNGSFGLRDIKSLSSKEEGSPLLGDQNLNISLFKSQSDGRDKLRRDGDNEENICDMSLGRIVPKEETMTEDNGIQLDKSSKETFRIANISEFVDRANGRNIIILIADNQSHHPGKLISEAAGPESFEISSSSNAHLQTSVANSPIIELDNSTLTEDNNYSTGTSKLQISNQVVESPSQHLDEEQPAQELVPHDLITFPSSGTSLTLTSSSSSYSSSSCSSSPKSFHYKKSPLLGSPNDLETPSHLLLSPSQLKSNPSSPPLPLILPKRGKRTLQERRKIKKWQNIEAARRYRDRKKLEMETSITQVKILEAANKQLYEKMDVLTNKVSSLKKILSRLGLLT